MARDVQFYVRGIARGPFEARKLTEPPTRILKDASPAALPVELPSSFDFVVNVRTAQELGLTTPPDVAAQVTHWIP
jgi:hypothetical protein